jgi:hypothetical protein
MGRLSVSKRVRNTAYRAYTKVGTEARHLSSVRILVFLNLLLPLYNHALALPWMFHRQARPSESHLKFRGTTFDGIVRRSGLMLVMGILGLFCCHEYTRSLQAAL